MIPDAKIHDIAVAYVLKSVLHQTDWPHTVIGKLHPLAAPHLSLADGELTILSAYFSDTDWYAFTTRRIISCFRGEIQSLATAEIAGYDFGNFKGYGPAEEGDETGETREVAVVPFEIARITSKSGQVVSFQFATWEESTLPLQAIQYWHAKHPFLHKLMTTAERENFRQQNG